MKRTWMGLLIGLLVTTTLGLYIASCSQAAPVAIKSASSPNPKVRLGIDNIGSYIEIFKNKRVGLITNHTGMNSQFESSIDVLKDKTSLTALFSPEHGIRGNAQAGDNVGTYVDEKSGITVYSLYGKTKKPTPDMVRDIDILAFDMQDIGARPYTYMYTMALAMQSTKENGKKFVVFDRPNPVGGEIVEGDIIHQGYESFIGMYPIPLRHGLTIGEMARLMNAEYGIGCDLMVIPMTGWKRNMFFEDTGLPWVMTSPNIPTADTALLYSGTCILGGTNITEGIGTTRPFELVGAPWVDAAELARRGNDLKLPGVIFRPAYFTPRQVDVKYQGQLCGGVQLHVVDRKIFRPVRTTVMLLNLIQDMGGDKFRFNATGTAATPRFDLYTGDNRLRLGSLPLEELLTQWDNAAAGFKEKSKRYWLYTE